MYGAECLISFVYMTGIWVSKKIKTTQYMLGTLKLNLGRLAEIARTMTSQGYRLCSSGYLVYARPTLPIVEILSGKNVRAFLVCGFLMKSFKKNILKI